MTYAEYCAEKCEWCADGYRFADYWPERGKHVTRNGYVPCTAPTRDQFEAELQLLNGVARAEIERLKDQNDKDNAAWNEVVVEQNRTLINRKNEVNTLRERISELERENAELRKDKARLEKMISLASEVDYEGDHWFFFENSQGCGWHLYKAGTGSYSGTDQRECIDSALRDAAMQSAGEQKNG